ncbi:unnamed protein product [Periconia digitata]|uniref:Uncharacterized protein n=1 Tax=Periconia digitata TaxID=1303443 RepID=A0A9W4U4Q4_9PLEO|nr:unnamed protein product [Periconia digitata]
MILSLLLVLATAVSSTLAAAVAVTVPHPVVIREASLVKDEAIVIPTLLPRGPTAVDKRDNWPNHGYTKVGKDDREIKMNEPEKEIWCWWLDDTDKKDKKAGSKFKVKKGSICYFYEYPCDPSKGKAFYAKGNDSETNYPSDKYMGFGCEKKD